MNCVMWAALDNSGYFAPAHWLTVNLAPAGQRRRVPHYNLPIAAVILLAAHHGEAELADAAYFGTRRRTTFCTQCAPRTAMAEGRK
jgi:predicted ATPase with chaperone activity